MQFILNHQVRWWQPLARQRMSDRWLAGSIEPVVVVTLHQSKERPNFTGPWHSRKLVYRGDHKTGQTAIDRLVHGQDGQSVPSAEGTVAIHAGDTQVSRRGWVWQKFE